MLHKLKKFTYKSYTSSFSDIPAVMNHMRIVQEELESSQLHNLGFFNKTYYIITKNVYTKISSAYFQYPLELRQLDINFAKYYFDALKQFADTQTTTPAWQTAFISCKKNNSIPLIYMALGVNAHVNNDLGMSLYDTINRNDYKKDYDKVNAIIYESLDEVINELQLQYYLKPFMGILIKRWRNNAWVNYDYLQNERITPGQIETKANTIAHVLAKVRSTRDFYQLYQII